MRKPNGDSRSFRVITHIFCVIVGLTFIFSGFVKSVDPWGTAIKFEEYFNVYGLEQLLPLSRVLAIWLCGAELMMGCMVLFRVRLRLISIFALLSMIIFTGVSVLSMTLFPVGDCGCFGDAFYLTPLQTLLKNLVLLPMVATIWWWYRPNKILVYKRREVILATTFCCIAMGFSTYNFFHLPLIDFLPYKVGVNLLEQTTTPEGSSEYEVILRYRNTQSGQLRDFSIEDSEWHDTQKWEWVETITQIKGDKKAKGSQNKSLLSDFMLQSLDGVNATWAILTHSSSVNIISIYSLDKLRSACQRRLEDYIEQAHNRGEYTVVVTAQRFSTPYIYIGSHQIECYNIDPITQKSLMRATVGVVELLDGVITSKRSCLDIL